MTREDLSALAMDAMNAKWDGDFGDNPTYLLPAVAAVLAALDGHAVFGGDIHELHFEAFPCEAGDTPLFRLDH